MGFSPLVGSGMACFCSTIVGRRYELKLGEFGRWAKQELMGMGVCWFANSPNGNHWLLDALKLCTNTFGVRVALGYTLAEPGVLCRCCGTKPKTLGHVQLDCGQDS